MAEYSGNPNVIDDEALKYLEAAQAGDLPPLPAQPAPFVPDYRTAESASRSMIENPLVPFEEKIPSIDYIQKIKEQQSAVQALNLQKEKDELEKLNENYMTYKGKAEQLGLPVPPMPSKLSNYISAKEQEAIDAAQAKIQERNAADLAVGEPKAGLKISQAGESLNEPFLKALEPGYQKQRSSLDQQVKIGQDKAAETVGYYDKLQKDLEAAEQSRVAAESERQLALGDQLKKLDQVKSDLASTKVDPSRIWKEKGTGSMIAAAIMQGLGAFASARWNIAGGDLPAKIISQAVDRDIEAQKEEIAKKKGLVDAESNVYQMMRQRFGDDRLAESATRQYLFEGAKLRLDQLGAKYQGAEAQAKVGQLKGALDVEQQKDAMLFAKTAADIYDTKAKSANLNADKYVPSLQQYALTAEDAKEMKKASSDLASVKSGLSRLKEIRSKYGSEIANRPVVKEAKTIATDMLLKYKNIAQLGVLSESDKELLDRLIPADPTQFEWTGSTNAQLDAFGKLVERGYSELAISKGLNPSAALEGAPETKVIGSKTYTKVGPNQWQVME